MFLFDAARADFFGVYGQEDPTTPYIDRAAGAGVVFRNHISASFNTRTSISQIFTSRYEAFPLLDYFQGNKEYPWWMRDEVMPRSAALLTRSLAANGYRTVLVTTHPLMTPGSVFVKSFTSFVHVKPEPDEPFAPAERVFRAAAQSLREHESRFPNTPLFLYIHVLDTHLPYILDGSEDAFISGKARTWTAQERRKRRPVSLPQRQTLDPATVALLRGEAKSRYRYLDAQFGRFLASLPQTSRRPYVWLLTADHGDALGEEGYVGHHYGTFSMEVLHRVPLILGGNIGVIRRARVDALTSSVDIFPTLFDIAGIPVPDRVRIDGRSLLPLVRGLSQVPRSGALEVMRVGWKTSRLAWQTNDATWVTTEYDEVLRKGKGEKEYSRKGLLPSVSATLPPDFVNALGQYRQREERREAIALGKVMIIPSTEFVLDSKVARAYDLCWAIPSWRYYQDRLPLREKPSCEPLRFHVDLPPGYYSGSWSSGFAAGGCAGSDAAAKPLLQIQTSATPEPLNAPCSMIAGGNLPLGDIRLRRAPWELRISALVQRELWLGAITLVRKNGTLTDDRTLTPEQIQRLRSLGYIR